MSLVGAERLDMSLDSVHINLPKKCQKVCLVSANLIDSNDAIAVLSSADNKHFNVIEARNQYQQ